MPRRPGHPPSRDELIGDFAALRAEGLDFWRSIDDAVFWTAPAPGWSPADNVRHLILSTRPVALALRVPRLALGALFGTSVAPSRAPAALRTAYLERLAGGGSAGGYAPRTLPPPAEPATARRRLLERCAATLGALERAVRPWDEAALDRYRLPHPLLGRITLREMLLFTLLHFDHHRDKVAARLGIAPG